MPKKSGDQSGSGDSVKSVHKSGEAHSPIELDLGKVAGDIYGKSAKAIEDQMYAAYKRAASTSENKSTCWPLLSSVVEFHELAFGAKDKRYVQLLTELVNHQPITHQAQTYQKLIKVHQARNDYAAAETTRSHAISSLAFDLIEDIPTTQKCQRDAQQLAYSGFNENLAKANESTSPIAKKNYASNALYYCRQVALIIGHRTYFETPSESVQSRSQENLDRMYKCGLKVAQDYHLDVWQKYFEKKLQPPPPSAIDYRPYWPTKFKSRRTGGPSSSY